MTRATLGDLVRPQHGPANGILAMESEFCGPTFSEDGRALILSVQHPGEGAATRRQGALEVQHHVVHDRADRPLEQTRKVPVGSNFPAGTADTPPRPAVVCIRRDDVQET